jgi:cell division protein FtsL
MRTDNHKKIKWHKMIAIAISFLVMLFLLFLRIWLTSDAVEIAVEINDLNEKKELIEEENKKMLVEIGKLKSPDRIGNIAVNDLNMVMSPDTKVIFLEKKVANK